MAAYAKLAPNPGSLTRGGAEGKAVPGCEANQGTIDGTSLKTLKSLQLSVLEGRFQWGVAVYIPKPKGGPLGIAEFQDRIVQEVIRKAFGIKFRRRLLDAIFDPQLTVPWI